MVNLFVCFREVREELLKIARENASRKISLSLVEEGVLGELQNLAWEVLEEEKAERDARLQQLAEQIMKRRMARYFNRYCGSLHERYFFKMLEISSRSDLFKGQYCSIAFIRMVTHWCFILTSSKIRTTLYCKMNSTTGKYCSVAFI